MALTKIKFENFTAFRELTIDLSPGVNIFIGENGTGKTHILKAAYAACDKADIEEILPETLLSVFTPHGFLGNLIHTNGKQDELRLEVNAGEKSLTIHVRSRNGKRYENEILWSPADGSWSTGFDNAVYIPVKDILADAAGFRSLYKERIVAFEEVYLDILNDAFLPVLREIDEPKLSSLLTKLEKRIGGKTRIEGETFFWEGLRKPLEFHLLAEGLRRLALLWILIRNGSINSKTIIFWDEPEANLNPKLYGVVVDVLLELQRIGCQILLATHDYVILKEFDLQSKSEDKVTYHSLYRDKKKKNDIQISSTDSFSLIEPNAISDTFADLYDRDVQRALKRNNDIKAK